MKTKKTKTTPAWEQHLRARTAEAVSEARSLLTSTRTLLLRHRAQQDRDIAKAFGVLDALQAWVDGGKLPGFAFDFARLHALMNQYGAECLNDKGHAHQDTVGHAHDAITGVLDHSAYDCDDALHAITLAMEKPLRVACGFEIASDDKVDTEKAA